MYFRMVQTSCKLQNICLLVSKGTATFGKLAHRIVFVLHPAARLLRV